MKNSVKAIVEGINETAKSVTTTLGPLGKNVIIDDDYIPSPFFTKDGVTVAKEIRINKNHYEDIKSLQMLDRYKNIGVKLVRDVALKTNSEVGDGTTTSVVLLDAILKSAFETFGGELSEANPHRVKQQICSEVDRIIDHLENIKKTSDIHKVALISSNGDKVISDLVSKAIKQVGYDGMITIEESNISESHLEIIKGMKFNKGFLSPYFINDMNKMLVSYESAFVFLTDEEIVSQKQIYSTLKFIEGNKRPIIFIAKKINNQVVSNLALNTKQQGFSICAVELPWFDERQNGLLEDLSILTGAKVVGKNHGINLAESNPSHLGICRSFKVSKSHTEIVTDPVEDKVLKPHIERIKIKRDNTSVEYEKEALSERIGRLTDGVCAILVGGHSEAEIKESKFRFEDALNACISSREGVIQGGGYPFLIWSLAEKEDEDAPLGARIITEAVKAPFYQIMRNAGKTDKEIEEIISWMTKDNQYFNPVNRETFNDWYEKGIMDPFLVTKHALLNAVSVAALLITTGEVVLGDEVVKNG